MDRPGSPGVGSAMGWSTDLGARVIALWASALIGCGAGAGTRARAASATAAPVLFYDGVAYPLPVRRSPAPAATTSPTATSPR